MRFRSVRMRVFITGSKGQLGQDCLRAFAGRHEVRGADLPEFDITAPASIESALGGFRPDVILNCAAYTQVDRAETDREAARRVNADGPRLLAEIAERAGAHLVHLSTDYVFDGRRPPPQPYAETDPPAPVSFYGVTKLAGEQAVRETAARYAIVRTAWLYGLGGRNFLKTVLRLALARPGAPLRVVADQHGCPTWSQRLARQLLRLVEAGACGLYHAAAEGHCTRYEEALHFLTRLGVQPGLVPCATADYPTAARRPMNSILENTRLRAEGCGVMRDWREDMDEFVARHRDALLREASAA